MKRLREEGAHPIQDAMRSGKSVFITGAAGTGKSYIVREIIQELRAAKKPGVFVTASTGIAASLLDGTTIHSFAGAGIGTDFAPLLRAVLASTSAVARWVACAVLVVDEVSMVDGAYFDALDAIARACRGNTRPFGGIQVIASGDFHQLPPVKPVKLCFEAAVWPRLFAQTTFVLRTVRRQTDVAFAGILARMRGAALTAADARALALRNVPAPEGTVRLFTHRAAVHAENARCLSDILARTHTFTATDLVPQGADAAQLDRACPAEKTVALKVGAPVILIQNVDVEAGLYNGAQGTVVRFDTAPITRVVYPVVRFDSCVFSAIPVAFKVRAGKKVLTRTQIPLALAFAFSIHKAQGMTLRRVEVDVGRAWEAGQVYTAFSRAVSLDGLFVRGFDPANVTADPRVVAFYSSPNFISVW